MGLENWFLTSETERATERFLDPSAPMGISTEIPAPGELVSSALELPPAGVAGQAFTAGSEQPAEPPVLERPVGPAALNEPIQPAENAPLDSPETPTQAGRFIVVPSPSEPEPLSPQHDKPVSFVRAQVWLPPAVISTRELSL